MTDTNQCEWLLHQADMPIRYRVTRELLCDERAASEMEPELLVHPAVMLWLRNLKPQSPPQHRWMEHGSFDFCLENAMLKSVQLGLHAGLLQVRDAAAYYTDKIGSAEMEPPYRNWDFRSGFDHIITCNMLSLAGIDHDSVHAFMLQSLDELYRFVQKGDYHIYCSEEEKAAVKGLPKIWADRKVIRQDLMKAHGFCYPLIYDLVGLHTLDRRQNPETGRKIDAVIDYISTDLFHEIVPDGYGIIPAEQAKCYSMGWDPKYPGWFNVSEYMGRQDSAKNKLLFFALYIARYPGARKTKWFCDLLAVLEEYRTGSGTYRFPTEWLREAKGYAVLGNHLSFGENRRKRNWCEIESTFFMQLLYKELSHRYS